MLQILDGHWREHLAALDHLRQGIHLRGYAQKNPKQEYKREAFELFGAMLEAVKLEVTKVLVAVEIRTQEAVPKADDQPHVENVRLQHADFDEALGAAEEPKKAQPARAAAKVGRNEPCPCGSGRKYKHCHGKLT
jgi:preprotein translocase subunit SecA